MMRLEAPATPTIWREPPVRDAAPDPLAVSSLLQVIRRRWPLFVSMVAAGAAIALAASFMLPKQYTAATRLTIDPRPHSSPLVLGKDATAAPDSVLVDTEIGLITSPSVAGAVVRSLNLTHDPEFGGSRAAAFDSVVDKVGRHISATREGLTYIVVIRARSADPRKAARIANAVAEQYVSTSRGLRAAAAADQARALTSELGYLRQQVIQADADVEAYRAANGIVASRAADGGTVTDQQIHSLASEYGHAADAAALAQATARTAEDQAQSAGVESVSQVLAADSLRELRNQRAQVLREQAQIATVYGPEHPAQVRINQQLAQLDREIKSASERVVEGLQSDARAATQRAGAVRNQLSALEARQTVNAKAAVVADGLQRDADAKRSTYNELSRDAEQQAQEARIGDVRAWRMSFASPPAQPSFPNKKILLMLGALCGAAVGSGVVIAAELAEKGFRSGPEAQSELGLPLLASAPELAATRRGLLPAPSARRRDSRRLWNYVVGRPTSSYAEAIRNIRGTLVASDAERRPMSICVTSALAGEGKTLTAVSLARVMAMSGDRVLLVDCDLRRTGLAPLRNSGPAPDLIGVLSGDSEPQQAVIEDLVPGLTFLGLDQPVFTARDVFSGPVARKILERLKESYDFVVLDAPPVLAVTDSWALASTCDATVLVVRHAKTPRVAARAAVERLRQCGARLHGVVINRRIRHGLSVDDPARYYVVHSQYYHD